MTREQDILLYLMRASVQGTPVTALPPGPLPDWMEVYREAYQQAVPLLFFDAIAPLEAQIPTEVFQKSFEIARRVTAANLRVEHAQHQLVQVLESEQIPYVILKGEGAAADYPVPELRVLGDVDFLIPDDTTKTVKEKMEALGYVHSWEPEAHHQVLGKPGICLEMHMEVAGVPEGQHRAATLDFFRDIYEKSIPLDRGAGAFQVPCRAHHGLILILHMQHHIVLQGMGLRHIMDWGCFVDKTQNEPFWKDSLLPMLKKIGLRRFAAVITKLSSLYLGTACPAWANDVPRELCESLMEDVMNGGNFGRKDQDRARAINMMPHWESQNDKSSKMQLLYRTLRTSVVRDHPDLEEKPVSLFFHMTGKSLRYTVLFCQGKRPNLLKAASHADTRRSIYEQLEMFHPEK